MQESVYLVLVSGARKGFRTRRGTLHDYPRAASMERPPQEGNAMTPWQALRVAALALIAALVAMPFATVTAQEEGTRITVELQEFEDSGISGTATLTATDDGGTQVSMELQGEELDGDHPTHIHTGTCDDFDPDPLYPLETVELSAVSQEGISETTVEDVLLGAPVAVRGSLRAGDYVILVHQSPEELTNYLVCGEISSGTLEEADAAEQSTATGEASDPTEADAGDDHAGAADHSPQGDDEEADGTEESAQVKSITRTGTGPTGVTEGQSGTLLPIVLGVLATLAILSAVTLRRRGI